MTMVEEVDFHIKKDFMQTIFESCKDITMQGGMPVMFGTMCGQWGQHCNPERLFEYMGSGPPGGPAPFTINYKIHESDKIKRADLKITPLNDKMVNGTNGCEEGVSVRIRLCI